MAQPSSKVGRRRHVTLKRLLKAFVLKGRFACKYACGQRNKTVHEHLRTLQYAVRNLHDQYDKTHGFETCQPVEGSLREASTTHHFKPLGSSIEKKLDPDIYSRPSFTSNPRHYPILPYKYPTLPYPNPSLSVVRVSLTRSSGILPSNSFASLVANTSRACRRKERIAHHINCVCRRTDMFASCSRVHVC